MSLKRGIYSQPPPKGPSGTAPNKTDVMESNLIKDLMGAAQLAAPNREEVIKLRPTDLLLLLFNIRKNIKSKLFGFATNQDMSEQERTLVDATLIDMGIIWRHCTPTTEERESGFTWGDYAKKCATPYAYAQGILTLQKGPDK